MQVRTFLSALLHEAKTAWPCAPCMLQIYQINPHCSIRSIHCRLPAYNFRAAQGLEHNYRSHYPAFQQLCWSADPSDC